MSELLVWTTSARSVRPEPWAFHLFGLVTPIVIIISLLEGSFWMMTGTVLVLGLYPLLDILLSERQSPAPSADDGRPYEAILMIHALAIPVLVAVLLWRAHLDGPTMWMGWGIFSAGIVGGASGIITAHELGHRRPGSFKWMVGRFTMFMVNYSHFTIEHNYNHHNDMALPSDAASAPASRGLWLHIAMTVPWQFISAVKVDFSKRSIWGNRALRGFFLQISAIIALGLLLSWWLALVWVLFGATAVILLEYVNYIRHYGLRRKDDERQTEIHSWQSEARWSRWTLLELTRHPAHHMKASLPYWQLQPCEGVPTLPTGYYGCFWPCTIPPLWKRWMRSRIPESMRQT